MPYWLAHALAGLAISGAGFLVVRLTGAGVAIALAGALYYLGREMAQRGHLGRWDWPGLLALVAACGVLAVVVAVS